MTDVFRLLEDEWQHLDRAPVHRRLRNACRLAGNARRLTELERYVHQATPDQADAVLLALAGGAVAGDALSARVLLQLLIPGTRRLAHRWWALGDHHERAAAAVAAVYGRIRNYPLARRPGRVAANILLDAQADLRRMVPKPVVTLTAEQLEHHETARRTHSATPDRPASELLELIVTAVEGGVIKRDDAELIARSRVAGHRLADIAAVSPVGLRTLQHRRRMAELALVKSRVGRELAG